MSLRVHLQLLTPVWHNLSIFRSRTTFICLVICTGQYLVRRKRNQKRNRKWTRTQKRKTEMGTEPSIYATSAWACVYIRLYALSSPNVCPYTSWTYGVSFTSQQFAPARDPNLYTRAISSSVPQADISDDGNIGNVLMNKVQVSAIARAISTSQTTKTDNVTITQGKSVDAHDLAQCWMIPI